MTAAFVPRLVALDVDGCLLEWVPGTDKADERVSPAVREAVRRVVAAGVPVALASGRSAAGLAAVADLLGLPLPGGERMWLVASNGAVLARTAPLEVVSAVTFDASDAVARVLEKLPDALVAVEDPRAGYRVTGEFPRGELSARAVVVPPEQLAVERASRVVVRHPEASAGSVAALAEEVGLHGTDYVVGFTTWLDLTPAGVSKATGLATAASALGVASQDVLAVGDGLNDLAMLSWAGRGVAMGHAPAPVLAAADAVTGTVAEDGLAAELARWF